MHSLGNELGETRHRRCPVWVLLAALGLPLLGFPQPAAVAENDLILGVFPRRNPSDMVEMFTPLADYLGRKLRRSIKIETTPDFNLFWEAVAAKRYHIVHYNQYHYIRSHKLLDYRIVGMNEEAGKSLIAGILVTRFGSGIDNLADLRGRTIVFGGNKHAMNSYITPTYLLRQAGLKAADYQEEFATNPPNVALAVFFKRAIAGGVGDILYDTPFVQEKIDVSKLVTLAKSPQVPHLPWAVRGDLPAVLQEAVKKALLEIRRDPDAAQILKSAALTNVVEATDIQYNYVREIVGKVMEEYY